MGREPRSCSETAATQGLLKDYLANVAKVLKGWKKLVSHNTWEIALSVGCPREQSTCMRLGSDIFNPTSMET